MTAVTFQFGEFELDCERFELRRGPHPVRLERKPLELLILLASSGSRLVTRDEIARCLWPSEVFVDTEHGINTAVRKIRHALRDDPDHPRFLQTVTGKGYRFMGVIPKPQPAGAPHLDSETRVSRDAAATQPVTHARRLWLTASAVVVLAVIIGIATFGVRNVRGHSAPAPIDPAAREAYLHGHYLWFSRQEVASGAYFLKATQLAPNYAPGWAGLADYYGAGMVDGDLDPRQNLPLEDAAAHRAVQLDDSLPEAHLAFGASNWVVDWNFPAALQQLDRAIQLDPRFSEAIHLRAKLLGQLNRHDEAIAGQRVAMELNPLERPWALAYFLLQARRFDNSIAEARQRLEGHPNTFTWAVLREDYRAKGMDKETEHAHEQSLILAGNPSAANAAHRAFARGGIHEVVRQQLAELTVQSKKHYVSPFAFAVLYAELGDNQHALSALDEAVRQHSPMIFDLQNDTAFDPLHTDPHYRAIVRKVGLQPVW
jgi:DNA-binding winged helix-turn-helix (wHTH) protein/tetratricopeptide (TPR) repeat protein